MINVHTITNDKKTTYTVVFNFVDNVINNRPYITYMPTTIYDFQTQSLKNTPIDFNNFQGKVIIVVNTASKCGFTPQYEGLQKLYDKYGPKGLVIVGFPCNQFGGQEPGEGKDIEDNCLVNYGVTFDMANKIEVNGDNTDPIFVYLKDSVPGLLGMKAIKWNFTKFLIDKNGIPVKRFAPTVEPVEMEKDIENLLS
jgi:glutathione peroxidase